MTREEYLSELFEAYSPVAVLSDKNGCKVIKVKNRKLGRYMVVRSFSESIAAALRSSCSFDEESVMSAISQNGGKTRRRRSFISVL